MYKLTFFLALMAFNTLGHSQELTFTSSAKQTHLIELFSSEGCSSCPPADQFISQFKGSKALWREYIPLVFHVDYWDYLGWEDPFAAAAYSNRQRDYKKHGHTDGVYTPGFVVNGQEWTGFFKPLRAFPEIFQYPGKLQANIHRQTATLEFSTNHTVLDYHMVIVGLGLNTTVTKGENAGHVLTHDFVVLDHQQASGGEFVTMNLPLIVKHKPEQFALIAWVTQAGDMQPIQAVGGVLPAGHIKQL